MRWLHLEYVLKGVFLALILFAGIREQDWASVAMCASAMFGGLALAVVVGAWLKGRQGYHPRGKLLAFVLFLLLENTVLVYVFTVLGLLVGVCFIRQTQDNLILPGCMVAGALLGLLFLLLPTVRPRNARLALGVVLATLLAAATLLALGKLGDWLPAFRLAGPADTTLFGTQLILGMMQFLVLLFAGRGEESELEVGMMCAFLGLALYMVTPPGPMNQALGYLLPLLIYFWYTTRFLPRLRVLKLAIRGFGYAQAGKHREAIIAFRRAMQLDPSNEMAREGLWAVHRNLDFEQLGNDPDTLKLVDLDLCLQRAGSLLLQPRPSEARLQEARRLLDLVHRHRPGFRAPVYYWRAVASTHAKAYEQAAEELQQVLDPSTYTPDDSERRATLLQAWQLALRAHPELTRRVGTPELALSGRRIEAITAVERHLADNPDDQEVWGFKRMLYQDLTGADYRAALGPDGKAPGIDHAYAQQLGLALITDANQWRRGADYLRIAAHGLPLLAPSLHVAIAQAAGRAGEGKEAWTAYESARDAGRVVGVKKLDDENRQAYFAAVKLLADAALKHDRLELAIENYLLFTESDRSGVETLRTLAGLYERKEDPLLALRATEQALIYSPKDKDLLERKDRYYYSVLPKDLAARLDLIRSGFDVGYCLRKARQLLDYKNWDLEMLDWAQHLVELVRVVQPDNRLAKVLVARALLRRGEKGQAATLLEEAHSPKPEKFTSTEDEEAWFTSCKLLGELYLYDLNKPEQAIECFKSYRESSHSGADTIFKLGQAYEQLGDRGRAVKFYKHVASYNGHPLASEAHDAAVRLEAS